MPVIIDVSPSQQIERMGTVVANNRGQLEARKDPILPGALQHGRDDYLVPLIKGRKTTFRRQISLIIRSVVSVEIGYLVNGFTVGVIPEDGVAITEALPDFENTAMVKSCSR